MKLKLTAPFPNSPRRVRTVVCRQVVKLPPYVFYQWQRLNHLTGGGGELEPDTLRKGMQGLYPAALLQRGLLVPCGNNYRLLAPDMWGVPMRASAYDTLTMGRSVFHACRGSNEIAQAFHDAGGQRAGQIYRAQLALRNLRRI